MDGHWTASYHFTVIFTTYPITGMGKRKEQHSHSLRSQRQRFSKRRPRQNLDKNTNEVVENTNYCNRSDTRDIHIRLENRDSYSVVLLRNRKIKKRDRKKHSDHNDNTTKLKFSLFDRPNE